jgi:CrcB protein
MVRSLVRIQAELYDDAPPGPVPRMPQRMPKLDRGELAAIFCGGVLGAFARAGLAELIGHPHAAWPWATLAVNLIGAFLLGLFVTRLQERLPLSAYKRPFLGTGLCGALTTFSTVQIELFDMLDAGRIGLALGYATATVAGGFAAVLLATKLVRRARVAA